MQNLLTGNRHSFYLTQAVEAERQKPGVITGLWPTPVVGDATGGRTSKGKDRPGEGGLRLEAMKREKWPTPATRDHHARLYPTPTVQDVANCGGPSQANRNSLSLNAEAGGGLNPAWVEWLMGWPAEWTNPACSLLTTEPDTWAQEPPGLPRLAPKSMPASERRARLSILGNGWVPQVAMVVLARIVGALEGEA